MLAPIKGKLLLTQLFGSKKGGPAEAYSYQREGQTVHCIAHPALDINCPTGTQVYAVKGGTITHVDLANPFLGMYVVLTDALGGEYHYAHLSDVRFGVGDVVNAGEWIGLSGATGNVTGPHLHFAVRDGKKDFGNGFDAFIDPLPRFDHDIVSLIDCSLV